MELEEIILPAIKTVSETEISGNYIIEPLYPGYGMTVGNALRRVLLSSLPGAAVSAIKIENASHEFSAISGVKEDILNIVLNFKLLRVALSGEAKHRLTLSVKGAKKVTAKDIKTDSDVVIANPDLYLFTTTDDKAKVEMEIEVEKGRGYVSAEERKEKRPIGEIAIDSLFSPVSKVAYSVENTRVGQITTFDKINLEIKTDGSISPKQALLDAAGIMVEQFSVLAGLREPTKQKEKKASAKRDEKNDELSIEEVDFTTRTINALLKNNIKNIGQLVKMTNEEIGSLRGMGSKAQEEIAEKLVELGVK
ncbi:DNA-directed RNA polymerase subunit alpha [Candidatus Microgenomates bacterium]|nr:DNA-directed RNA polymerase subunit alpha [Candidatus Microgenomates bacterium]